MKPTRKKKLLLRLMIYETIHPELVNKFDGKATK